MSPDVSSTSNNYHNSFLIEDGLNDLVWFTMSTDVNTSLPIMGPTGLTSNSSTVFQLNSYNVYFYYTQALGIMLNLETSVSAQILSIITLITN